MPEESEQRRNREIKGEKKNCKETSVKIDGKGFDYKAVMHTVIRWPYERSVKREFSEESLWMEFYKLEGKRLSSPRKPLTLPIKNNINLLHLGRLKLRALNKKHQNPTDFTFLKIQ